MSLISFNQYSISVQYPMGTGPFPGVKMPGRGVDILLHLTLSLYKVCGALRLLPVRKFVACCLTQITITFTHNISVSFFEKKACFVIVLNSVPKFCITQRYLRSPFYLVFYNTIITVINPLNAKLNPTCHLLALLTLWRLTITIVVVPHR